MNKLLTKVAKLVLGLSLAAGVGVAVGSQTKASRVDAAEKTFSHTDIVGMATAAAASTSGTYDVFTITVDGIASSGFNASESVRVYKGADITISCSGGTMTEIVLTCTANGTTKYGPGCLTGTGYTAGTAKTGTWSGSSSSVTLNADSNQARISDFKITYTPSAGSKTPLDTPSNFSESNHVLTWDAVSDVDHYEVTVDNAVSPTNTGTTNSITLSGNALNNGAHTVSVVAKAAANSTTHSDSSAGVYKYAILVHAGTLADPYSVADARAAIDGETGTTNVYVGGIVTEIVTAWGYNNYQNITFDIKDEGGTDTFRVFRCVDGAADASEVRVDDSIIAHGNLTKYNSTYEFEQGCTLEDLTHPAVPTLLIENNNKIAPHGVARSIKGTIENNDSYTITWTCATNGVTISPSTSTDNASVSVTVANTVAVGTEITIVGTLSDAGNHTEETTFVVSSKAADSVANALTASEASTLVATGKIDGTPLYVKGYVTDCQASKKFFWLDDSKGTTKTFEIYNAANDNFSGLTNKDAYVVAHGSALKYNSTYEISNSVVDSSDYFEIASNSLEVVSGSSESITVSNASGTVAWSKTAGTGDITLTNTSDTGATVNGVSVGSAIITITVGNYSEEIAVTVSTAPPAVTGLTVYDEGLDTLSDGDDVNLDASSASTVSTSIMCEVSYSDSSTDYNATVVSSPSTNFSVSVANDIHTLTFSANGNYDVTISAGSFSITVTYNVTGIAVPDAWPCAGQYIVNSEGSYKASGVTYTFKMEFNGVASQLGKDSAYTFAPKALVVLTVAATSSEGEYQISYSENSTTYYLAAKTKGKLDVTTDSTSSDTHFTFSETTKGYKATSTSLKDSGKDCFIDYNPNSGNGRFAMYSSAQKGADFIPYNETIKAGAFIETYMHVEIDTSETGQSTGYQTCKGTGYYDDAKSAFNALDSDVREEFITNASFNDYYLRLVNWAAANGDALNSNNQLAKASKPNLLFAETNNSTTNTVAAVVVISMVSVTAIGGYFFIKRREQN